MNQSLEVAKLAIKLAISSRDEELQIKKDFGAINGRATAIDIGGNLPEITSKILERTLIAAKKNGVISDNHIHDGAVAGAAREALNQIATRTNGLSSGGKISVARHGEHLSVAIFMSVGLLHLNDIVIGLGHRAIPQFDDK